MARWLAPSAVAACTGALAGGIVEATGRGETGGILGIVATVGFLALAALPALLIASIVLRGVTAAWQPRRLADRLVEEGGSAPLLAAWTVVIWFALIGLALAMYQGVWSLANLTAWKPNTVSLAVPAIAIAMVLIVLALAWPAVRLVAAVLRRGDRWWRRRGRRSLITPWWIAGGFVLVNGAGIAAAWLLLVKAKLGAFDLSLFTGPLLGGVVALAVHVAWRRVPLRARQVAGGSIAALAVGAVACALIAAQSSPSLTLSIWGDRPLAGLAIDQLYDLDALRAGVSLAELAPTVARLGATHPDIILVTIDTVRADHTPPYAGKAEMPGLKHLGEIGAVFDWAFSPSNVTRRSIPSMITGLQPNRVHGRVVGWALRVDPRHVTLAERLKEGGYDTAGFMCCEGFWGKTFHTGLEHGLDHLEIEKNGPELAKLARAWLNVREQKAGNRPLFVWMHLLEPHNWTDAAGLTRSEDEKKRAYDHSLAVADAALVQLLGAFSNRAPADAPIVIVTADHGEGLGEHGHPSHSTDLYNSQTRVPLVIAGPGVHPGRVGETVSLTDLVPTVLELAGFEAPKGRAIDGRSLADLATGTRPPDLEGGEAFAAKIKDRSNPGGMTDVVRGRWKLISNDDGAFELYDTRTDPSERINLIGSPARARTISDLKALLDKREAAGDVSPFP